MEEDEQDMGDDVSDASSMAAPGEVPGGENPFFIIPFIIDMCIHVAIFMTMRRKQVFFVEVG